jgi:hypothetical protein
MLKLKFTDLANEIREVENRPSEDFDPDKRVENTIAKEETRSPFKAPKRYAFDPDIRISKHFHRRRVLAAYMTIVDGFAPTPMVVSIANDFSDADKITREEFEEKLKNFIECISLYGCKPYTMETLKEILANRVYH